MIEMHDRLRRGPASPYSSGIQLLQSEHNRALVFTAAQGAIKKKKIHMYDCMNIVCFQKRSGIVECLEKCCTQ